MKYPKHEDERGYFRELAKVSDLKYDIEQVSIFTINPSQTRGDHYHKKLIETFIILEGECIVTTTTDFTRCNPDVMGYSHDKNLKEGDSVTFHPEVQHKFYSEKGCKILVLADREFNPDEPDVYKY